MLKIEDILREDFDWENVEIDENEFDELENQLIINYLKKNSPKERQLLAIDWNFDNSKLKLNVLKKNQINLFDIEKFLKK